MQFILCLLMIIHFSEASSSKVNISIPEESCKPIDIRDKHPHLRDFLSVPRDQGAVGWCYGYVAADLLTVHTGVPVSAFHVSANFNLEVEKNFFLKLRRLNAPEPFFQLFPVGGQIDTALSFIQESKKICPESTLTSHYEKMTRLLVQLKTVESNLARGDEVSACKTISEELEGIKLLSTDVRKILDHMKRKEISEALMALVNAACGKDMTEISDFKFQHKRVPRPRPDEFRRGDFGSVEKRITKFFRDFNSNLDQGQPIGINFNTKTIMTDSNQSILHASTIVARKWENGRCMYKVRDSSGNRVCFGLRSDISCMKEEGIFWVSGQDLYDMTSSITYIEK